MTNTPVNTPSSAFTLVEILVTLTIIGMVALVATAVTPLSARDEAHYQDTLAIMDAIEQALLGVPPTHLAGERRYLGYIADMGDLPRLLGDSHQPAGLWTDRVADRYGAADNLPTWGYAGDESRLWIGWHGPYLQVPAGVLRDGWGNPIVFERFDISDQDTEVVSDTGRNLRFTSLGSDGQVQAEDDAAAGYEADIKRVVRIHDYLGSLAGYRDKEINSVMIYYPSGGRLTFRNVTFGKDGYFLCGEASDGLLPMGTRSLRCTTASGGKTVLFSLEPTANFLGTLR